MRQGVTFQKVSEAAESLEAQGVNPTIDRIREYLGSTGSNTTISKYLNLWRHTTVTPNENQKNNPPDLVQAAVQRVWQQIHEQADGEIEKIKSESSLLVQEAEAKAIQSEEECRRVIHEYNNLEQAHQRLSAEKELLTLDLKASREEYLILTERYNALEKRYADMQGLMSQYQKDLSESHQHEINRLDDKYCQLIDEIKTQNQTERERQMVLIDSLNTENKKFEKKIQDLNKEISDNHIYTSTLAATNKSLESERDAALKRVEDQDNVWNSRWNDLSDKSFISDDIISKINEFLSINSVVEKANTDLITAIDNKFFEIKDYFKPVASLIMMEKKNEQSA